MLDSQDTQNASTGAPEQSEKKEMTTQEKAMLGARKLVNTGFQLHPFILLFFGILSMLLGTTRASKMKSLTSELDKWRQVTLDSGNSDYWRNEDPVNNANGCPSLHPKPWILYTQCHSPWLVDKINTALAFDPEEYEKSSKVAYFIFTPFALLCCAWLVYICYKVDVYNINIDSLLWVNNWVQVKKNATYTYFIYAVGTYLGIACLVSLILLITLVDDDNAKSQALYSLSFGVLSSAFALIALYSPNDEILDYSKVNHLPHKTGWLDDMNEASEKLGDGIQAAQLGEKRVLKVIGLNESEIKELLDGVMLIKDLSCYDVVE